MIQKTFVFLAQVIALAVVAAGCSGRVLDKQSDHPSKASHVPLVRTEQRVLRYDCQSRLISDRWEVIEHPWADVEIHPRTNVNLYQSRFTNLRTGSSPSTWSLTNFRLDGARGFLNMYAVPGINEIRYEFYYCDRIVRGRDNSTTCDEPVRLGESGSLFVDVTYSERRESTLKTIHPTAAECAATPQPTPLPTLWSLPSHQ